VASAIVLRRVQGLCVTTNTPSRRLGDYVSVLNVFSAGDGHG
jgi:hypothetical protein